MQISRNIPNGPKSNNWVSMGICVIVCVQKPSHHLLQTFRPLRIVFHGGSLYQKQLSLFCLLRLISASAEPIGYITNFCSMIELLHELKNSSCQHRSIYSRNFVPLYRWETKWWQWRTVQNHVIRFWIQRQSKWQTKHHIWWTRIKISG